MYETILVPTDESEGSREALRHAIDIAEKYGATVHLVHVVDERVYAHYGGVDAIEHAEEALADAGEAALDAAAERVEAASLPVQVHVERAVPWEGIVDTARLVGADLVVMGTEPRSGEYRRLIGSVSERVLRTSSVPVHLVKAQAPAETEFEVREASEADADAVRALARRSMERSYRDFLDAEGIAEAVATWYGPEAFEELLAEPDTVLLLAVDGTEPVGFAQAHLLVRREGTTGELHWLHVDPQYRGRGVGALLFARTRAALDERDVDRFAALVLAEYDPGNAFYRSQGLEPAGTRTVRIAGEGYEEQVYVDPAAPEREPAVTAHTGPDGETLYVARDEREIGSQGPFFAAYRSPDREDRFGWFCSNCEGFDTAMDTMERIVCNGCGNRHKATRWDAVATE